MPVVLTTCVTINSTYTIRQGSRAESSIWMLLLRHKRLINTDAKSDMNILVQRCRDSAFCNTKPTVPCLSVAILQYYIPFSQIPHSEPRSQQLQIQPSFSKHFSTSLSPVFLFCCHFLYLSLFTTGSTFLYQQNCFRKSNLSLLTSFPLHPLLFIILNTYITRTVLMFHPFYCTRISHFFHTVIAQHFLV